MTKLKYGFNRGQHAYMSYKIGNSFSQVLKNAEKAKIPKKDILAFAAYFTDRQLNGGSTARIPYELGRRGVYKDTPEGMWYIYKHTKPKTLKDWKERLRRVDNFLMGKREKYANIKN